METPEFLAWSIEYGCSIRGEQDGSDPERTERYLRAARAASAARRENRIFEGLAVDPPYGFRVADALAIYGGESAVAGACRECPANALGTAGVVSYAGCYGIVALPHDVYTFHEAIERGMERSGCGDESATHPRWYGLWLDSPLQGSLLLEAFLVLEAATIESEVSRNAASELMLGLNAAYNAGGSLHARLYPPGKVEGTWWRLVPHCPRCKAKWPIEPARKCSVCGYVGHPAPDKKRRVRGRRPYARLDHVLGAGQSTEFLARYFDYQTRQQSPDRV